jgi:diguanylate cyclase (GGDEF)-like protein
LTNPKDTGRTTPPAAPGRASGAPDRTSAAPGRASGAPDRTSAAPDPKQPATPDGVAKDSAKLRILVVDDEPTIRGVIGQVLRMDGHTPTEVANAEEALAAFRAQPFPLVITDIIMGRMNGLELLREIRRIDPEALVVIMTSQASLEAATSALREGAYDFLVKPFDDLILITALVDRATEKLRLQARNKLLTNQLEVYAGELERLNRNLKDVADKDWLTGLFNRRYLRSALDSEISRSLRQKHAFSLVLLDVDHFKIYNDTHGHLAGDEVLRGVAKILQNIGRSEHLCARYGGEEFVVLMPEATREGALAAAERIRIAVQEYPFEERETQPEGAVTVSLGVATFPEDGLDGDALIGRADAALYLAKEKGRNCVQG